MFLVFYLHDQRFALPLSIVQRLFRAVKITPLPTAPSIVMGIINFSGTIVSVVDVRSRLHLPPREIQLADLFILTRTATRLLVFSVDSVAGLIDYPQDAIIAATELSRELEYIRGVAKLPDGLVLIQDLERFLSVDEESAIEKALNSVHL